MQKIFNLLKKTKNIGKKRNLIISLGLIFILSLFFLPHTAHALDLGLFDVDLENMLGSILVWITNIINSLLALLITLILSVLTNIATFNDFVHHPAVVDGWVLIRDLCNMFFIVILLIISVGTVLGIESYSYKNFLKKVIFMAILINFSKTIAGFLIDVSQIVMLTFVNAFRDVLATGFLQAFGINKMTSFAQSTTAAGETDYDLVKSLIILAVTIILGTILLMVLIAMVVMLAVRIVTLWILVILSPLAYLAAALPGSLGTYGKQWWQQFTQQLIIGPAIAFFIWLSVSIVAKGNSDAAFIEKGNQYADPDLGYGEFLTSGFILSYIIGVTLLLVGVKMASQMGGATGAAFGRTFNKLKSTGGRTLRKTGGYLRKGGKWSAGKLGQGVGYVGKSPFKGYGAWLRKQDGKGTYKEGSYRQLLAARSKDRIDKKQKEKQKAAKERLNKLGLGGKNAMAVLATRGDRPKNQAMQDAREQARSDAAKSWQSDKSDYMAKLKESKEKETERNFESDWKDNKQTLINRFKSQNPSLDLTDDQIKNRLKNERLASVSVSDSDAKEQYLEEKGTLAAEKAGLEFKPSKNILKNPFRHMYTAAAAEQADRNQAERIGEAIAKDPSVLSESHLVDPATKDIKSGAVKGIFGKRTTGEIDKTFEYWDKRAKDPNLSTEKREKAQKTRAALYKASKHLSEEKQDNPMAAKYSSISGDEIYAGQDKTETLSSVNIAKAKSDYLLDRDDGKKFKNRLDDYSQDGVTVGSLKGGGNLAAANFEQLQNIEGVGRLEGEKRAAGMHLKGEDATRAALGMKKMLNEQISRLQGANTDEDIKVELELFGVKPTAGADLQKLKQETLTNANKAVDNLSDQNKISSEGLTLVNKKRTGRVAKDVVRHERAHEVIDKLDPSGSAQEKIFDSMPAEQQAQAISYIKQERGAPNMSDTEAKKEWLADAYANTYKPGGSDQGKPVLPAGAMISALQNSGATTNLQADFSILTRAIENSLGKNTDITNNIKNVVNQGNTVVQGGAAGKQPDGGAAAMDWLKKLQAIKKVVGGEVKKLGGGSGNYELNQKLKKIQDGLNILENKVKTQSKEGESASGDMNNFMDPNRNKF